MLPINILVQLLQALITITKIVLFTLPVQIKHITHAWFYSICSFTKHAQYTYNVAKNVTRTCSLFILRFNCTCQAYRVLAFSPLSAGMFNMFILSMIETNL